MPPRPPPSFTTSAPTKKTTTDFSKDTTPATKTYTDGQVATTKSLVKQTVSPLVNEITDMVTDEPIITEEFPTTTNAIIQSSTPSDGRADGTTPPSDIDTTPSDNEVTKNGAVTVSKTIQVSTLVNEITDMVTDEPIITEEIPSTTNAIIQSSTPSDGRADGTTPPSDIDATPSDNEVTKNGGVTVSKTIQASTMVNEITDMVTDEPVITEEIPSTTNHHHSVKHSV